MAAIPKIFCTTEDSLDTFGWETLKCNVRDVLYFVEGEIMA